MTCIAFYINFVFNDGLPPGASKFEIKNLLKSLAKITFFLLESKENLSIN